MFIKSVRIIRMAAQLHRNAGLQQVLTALLSAGDCSRLQELQDQHSLGGSERETERRR